MQYDLYMAMGCLLFVILESWLGEETGTGTVIFVSAFQELFAPDLES